MRKLLLISMMMWGVMTNPANALEAVFFDSLYDVPVMEGLSEMKESSISFDKAQGRIIHIMASGENVQKDKVLAFYGQVLPQMGWRQVQTHIFTREQEKLEISFDKTKASEVVAFSLSPIER